MTSDQLDSFFDAACTTWLVDAKRIAPIREAWERRFADLDAQTFAFALERAEERHTRYLPTIPQILEIYREVDRAAANRERNHRNASGGDSAAERELTACECHREAQYFAKRAAEIHAERGDAGRTAFARWFERLAEYYASQAQRIVAGQGMEPPPKIGDVLRAMGIGTPDRQQEARRRERLERDADADAYSA